MGDRLKGKVAIVTGGANGIGAAVALKLASGGADIAIVDLEVGESAQEIKSEIEALGRRALVIPVDVSLSKEVNHAVERVTDTLGRVDILINNAGVAEEKPLLQMRDDDWHRVMDINLNGPFYFCRAVGQEMVERKRGKIINIGSFFGLVGYQNFASYSTSKGALLQFTRTLALE